ncbi:hypothetical protein B0H14DRAFT_3423354 [Mycena olivaceomarginata]|nr:hypothetical protein B0H14DRAFT_3423354 [Mycena olivaceomarginata]
MHTAIFSSSNTLAMQLLSPQIDALTDDEIALQQDALQQEWDDGAASTVPYHATSTGELGRPSSAAEWSRSQSQRPLSPFPNLESHPPGLHLPPTSAVQDFDSPFKVIPADGQRESFAGYPYPEGHRWPQTFKIAEIEQIRRRKQTVACFFCRSRKIACTPRPVDETDDEPCWQCKKRGFDCRYPKEIKRGQHNKKKQDMPSLRSGERSRG